MLHARQWFADRDAGVQIRGGGARRTLVEWIVPESTCGRTQEVGIIRVEQGADGLFVVITTRVDEACPGVEERQESRAAERDGLKRVLEPVKRLIGHVDATVSSLDALEACDDARVDTALAEVAVDVHEDVVPLGGQRIDLFADPHRVVVTAQHEVDQNREMGMCLEARSVGNAADTQTQNVLAVVHDVVRKRFGDPRIHFALNCASTSCPQLPDRAFTAEHLDAELDRETRRFVAQERNVRIDDEQRVVFLSQIFEWYEGDFVSWYEEQFPDRTADLVSYVSLYLPAEQAARLSGDASGYEVRFTPYDWSLNDQTRTP